jgi:hypothetical protein
MGVITLRERIRFIHLKSIIYNRTSVVTMIACPDEDFIPGDWITP